MATEPTHWCLLMMTVLVLPLVSCGDDGGNDTDDPEDAGADGGLDAG